MYRWYGEAKGADVVAECEEWLREGNVLAVYEALPALPHADRHRFEIALAERKPDEEAIRQGRGYAAHHLAYLQSLSDPHGHETTLGEEILLMLHVRYELWLLTRLYDDIYHIDLGIELGDVDERIRYVCSRHDIRGSAGRLYHALYFSR